MTLTKKGKEAIKLRLPLSHEIITNRFSKPPCPDNYIQDIFSGIFTRSALMVSELFIHFYTSPLDQLLNDLLKKYEEQCP